MPYDSRANAAKTYIEEVAEKPEADTVRDKVLPVPDMASATEHAVQADEGRQALKDMRTMKTGAPGLPTVWVLCRKDANGRVENLRAFTDPARAQIDLELVDSVSSDEFWLAALPLVGDAPDGATRPSPAQVLALSWLSQGAEAEVPVAGDDPVVINPRHVRGFVSLPPHEWREMDDKGWVRDGMITPTGAAIMEQAGDANGHAAESL